MFRVDVTPGLGSEDEDPTDYGLLSIDCVTESQWQVDLEKGTSCDHQAIDVFALDASRISMFKDRPKAPKLQPQWPNVQSVIFKHCKQISNSLDFP